MSTLLLTFTPRAERTKAPDYLTSPVPRSYHVWCLWSENSVTMEDYPDSSACIEINAAEDDDYIDDTWTQYITYIEFVGREGFKSAWRLARLFNRFGRVVLTRDEERELMKGIVFYRMGRRHHLHVSL